MRLLAFAKRNLLELVKDPLASVFFIVFPTVLFVVLQVLFKAMGNNVTEVPQFNIDHMTCSMVIFSFSFITIFVGNNFASDRESSFLLRLKSTPMTSLDFIFGYTLSVFPIVIVQELLMIVIGLCFGLTFSLNLLLVMLLLFPVSLLFIGLGLLLGSLVSSKGVGPLSSIGPTACGLLGGMFFPLQLMPENNAFRIICNILPFAPSIESANMVLNGDYNIIFKYLIAIGYTIVLYSISALIISYRLKHDKI